MTEQKDKKTTIQQVRDLVQSFNDERDWGQFHNPKDLAEAITLEAAELLEMFRWKSPEKSTQMLNDPEFRKKVGEEAADVFVFLICLVNNTGMDLTEITEAKVEQNRINYPKDKAKGKAKKYTEL